MAARGIPSATVLLWKPGTPPRIQLTHPLHYIIPSKYTWSKEFRKQIFESLLACFLWRIHFIPERNQAEGKSRLFLPPLLTPGPRNEAPRVLIEHRFFSIFYLLTPLITPVPKRVYILTPFIMRAAPRTLETVAPSRNMMKLFNGDCISILKTLQSNSVDLVTTDPPYLVNYRSRDGRTIANDTTDEWLEPAFDEIARVLKPNRFCISFYGVYKADRFLSAWKRARLSPVGHLVWSKSYASSQRFVRSHHECAYILAKGRPKRPNRLIDDVLHWEYTGNRLHPTQKPVSAIEPLIAAFSGPGEIVLDPFMGSGTTGRAAQYLGRRFIGIEIDKHYYRLASDRLQSAP